MNEQKISVRDAHIEMNLKCKTLEMENSEVTLSDERLFILFYVCIFISTVQICITCGGLHRCIHLLKLRLHWGICQR